MSDVAVIVDAVEPVVAALGLELYDVEVSGTGRATVVRVLVDREGGIDLDAVGAAAEAISPVLDGDRACRACSPGPYALEVSSPGLERPLRTPEHFRRAVGATVSVKLAGPPRCARHRRRGRRRGLRARARRRHARADPLHRRRPGADGLRVGSQRREEAGVGEEGGTAMNSEMMEALENIEREKGISIEIMLEALANALLTAYKRMPDAAEEALVEIDMETGAIKVIAQELDEEGNVTREWDDTPDDFGRIAAQTAKQVIFQRIREAEREMKYEEYAGREGDIVTGIIQQTDARYTLLDLGKVEALLPQAEQVQNEHYDHGSRLKAYIVEVRKTAKGPQIVVSRTHPGLVKRLFELEVPEIVDNVVELKAIAREPGHRTKIAVASNDQQRRPGRRVRRRARLARPHGRQRAARREGRHRPLQRRPGRVRDEGARAGAGPRGAHPPRHRHRRGDRPRLPAVARDRQGRPERAARGAAHAVGASTSRARRSSPRRSRAAASSTPRASGSRTTQGELVWQPAEGGETISAAEAGYAAPEGPVGDAPAADAPRGRRAGAPTRRLPATASAAEVGVSASRAEAPAADGTGRSGGG